MKKEDLKTGMVVKTRNGELYEVILGIESSVGNRGVKDILRNNNGWLDLEDYWKDNIFTQYTGFEEFDIMEVYNPLFFISNVTNHPEGYKLVWEREQEKFYLKHKWLNKNSGEYLNYHIEDEVYMLADYWKVRRFKTQFTLEDIENIERELGIKLDDFILIPINDVEK